MGQNEKVEKAPKTSWFSGLKAEFQKIIWPEKQSVIRQTIAVLAVSVVTGLIIALLDWGIQQGVDFLIGFHSVRMSLLILRHVVITLLTFCTCQCDSNAHNFHLAFLFSLCQQ